MTDASVLPPFIQQLDAIGSQIGNTPLFPIHHAWHKSGVQLYAKLEWYQLGKSACARSAYQIIRHAILTGKLDGQTSILDATNGNMGIAYASIAAQLHIPLTLCIPEDAAAGRVHLLKALGATLIFTPAKAGIAGAQKRARRLTDQKPERYFYADHSHNPENWRAHYLTTAREVYHETQGQITHFVAGMGDSGTFTGTGTKLREINSNIALIALQPEEEQGSLTSKALPAAPQTDSAPADLANQVIAIDALESYAWIRRFASSEGMLLSPAAAANLAGAIKVAEQLDTGVVVTVFPDDAEKYTEVIHQIFNSSQNAI